MSEVKELEGGSVAPAIVKNPADLKKLRGQLQEVVVILEAMQDKKMQKKILLDEIKRTFGISAGQASGLAATMFNDNYAEKRASQEEFETLYEAVIKSPQAQREIEEARPKFSADEIAKAVMAYVPGEDEE